MLTDSQDLKFPEGNVGFDDHKGFVISLNVELNSAFNSRCRHSGPETDVPQTEENPNYLLQMRKRYPNIKFWVQK
jgi:hypothetical protein